MERDTNKNIFKHFIIENSTRQKGASATFWGAKNNELEDSRDIIEKLIRFNNPHAKAKDLERLIMIERNQINTIGSFSGVNCMGKTLKICQIALLTNTQPSNFELLKTKQIYLFGDLLTFIEQ